MEQCSICLEALDGGVVALATCGHRFHAACLAQMAGAVGTATTRRGALTACPNCRTVSRVDPVMPVAAFSIGDRVSALWGHKWFPGVVEGSEVHLGDLKCTSATSTTRRTPRVLTTPRKSSTRASRPSTSQAKRRAARCWPRCRSSTTPRPQTRTRRNIGRRQRVSTTPSLRPPPRPLRLRATSGLSQRDALLHRRRRRSRDKSRVDL